MDATQGPLPNDNDSYLYYQPNLQGPSFQPEPADHIGPVGKVIPTGLESR